MPSALGLGLSPVFVGGPEVAPLFAPITASPPVVSGSTVEPSVLTSTTGTWTGFPVPTFAYQWQRNGVPVGGETSPTYATTSADLGDTIGCEVTATNTVGVGSALSNGVGPIT